MFTLPRLLPSFLSVFSRVEESCLRLLFPPSSVNPRLEKHQTGHVEPAQSQTQDLIQGKTRKEEDSLGRGHEC